MGAVLELPTTALPIQPIHLENGPFSWWLQNGPQNFDFFPIAMDADYSFELNFTETYAPPFCGH